MCIRDSNQDHEKVKMVTGKKRYIPSTADLKITSMGSLIDISDWYYNTYYEEGRMTHRGNWQGRLSGWLQQKVISSNNFLRQPQFKKKSLNHHPIQSRGLRLIGQSRPCMKPIFVSLYQVNGYQMVNAGLFVDIKVSTLTSPLEINLFIYVH